MKRTLKIVSGTIISFFIILLTTTYLLNIFYNPSQFKSLISSKILAKTGYTIKFNGDMSWMFFFHPGLRVYNMVIQNPASFKSANLGVIEKLEVDLKWLPLLIGKFEINNINVVGARFDLIKNKEGQGNWQREHSEPMKTVNTPVLKPTTVKQPIAIASKISHTKKIENTSPKTTNSISSINLEEVDISWEDEQKNQHYRLQGLNLHADDLHRSSFFPVATSGVLYLKDGIAPLHLSLALNLKINSDQEQYVARPLLFKVNNKRKGVEMNSSLKGDVLLDLKKEQLVLQEVKGNLSTLPFSANVNISQLRTKPAINGILRIDSFDLKEWLDNIREHSANLKQAKNLSADLTFSDHHGFNVAIQLELEKLQLNKTELSNLKLQASYENQLIDIASLTAEVFDGTLAIKANVNLQKGIPEVAAIVNLQQLKIKELALPLFEDLSITGNTNLQLEVKTAGKVRDSLLSNLNGKMQLRVTDGSLNGSLAPLLKDAKQAPFQQLSATIDILNGSLINNNLSLIGTSLRVNGSGNINLPASRIDYQINASTPESVNVSLSGVLAKPTVVVS